MGRNLNRQTNNSTNIQRHMGARNGKINSSCVGGDEMLEHRVLRPEAGGAAAAAQMAKVTLAMPRFW